jgi:hypothetical protein
VFESIKSIRPYFHSLREIENNVSLDIKLPLSWKYEEIIKPYRSVVVKIQDKNEKFTLMSLISTATQDGYDVVFACALEIFKINKDEEEKQKLFQSKVKELQELFKNESLDKLKGLIYGIFSSQDVRYNLYGLQVYHLMLSCVNHHPLITHH